MSLLVLVLSWGSMGLEAATAVVSAQFRPPDPGVWWVLGVLGSGAVLGLREEAWGPEF